MNSSEPFDYLKKSLDDMIADQRKNKGGKHSNFIKKDIQKDKSYLGRGGEDAEMQERQPMRGGFGGHRG